MNTWLIEFYNGPTVIDGQPQEPIEVVTRTRKRAPVQWARNHCIALSRKYQGAKITFCIIG